MFKMEPVNGKKKSSFPCTVHAVPYGSEIDVPSPTFVLSLRAIQLIRPIEIDTLSSSPAQSLRAIQLI